MALAVPLSRFTSQVGGGSAFFVRRIDHHFMSRITQGGTKTWCPHCKKIQICQAISASSIGEKSGQRWYRKDHDDIRWFRRARRCLHCEYEFLTAEVDEHFIDELVKLRDALVKLEEQIRAEEPRRYKALTRWQIVNKVLSSEYPAEIEK